MNKQELIASLDKDKNKFIDAATNIDLDVSSRNIACGIFTGIIIAKNHIERLDERIEPQAEKVEVPSMIAKFIKENSDPEQAQVLQAFATWFLEQEEGNENN